MSVSYLGWRVSECNLHSKKTHIFHSNNTLIKYKIGPFNLAERRDISQ